MTMQQVVFENVAPEDPEWTAHVKMLNEWTDPDRYLRSIIQYARSGPHYPADMHVNLIEQVMKVRERQPYSEADIHRHGSDLWPEQVLTKKPQ